MQKKESPISTPRFQFNGGYFKLTPFHIIKNPEKPSSFLLVVLVPVVRSSAIRRGVMRCFSLFLSFHLAVAIAHCLFFVYKEREVPPCLFCSSSSSLHTSSCSNIPFINTLHSPILIIAALHLHISLAPHYNTSVLHTPPQHPRVCIYF